MKLRFAPTSPYVRKVAVTAIEAGLDDRVERIETNVWDPATDIAEDNPLGKVPALTTDDGTVLCDSPVICEHLDSLHGGPKLIPADGSERWRVLNLQALADGIMDSAVARIIEQRMRPEEFRWDGWLTRQKDKITAALDVLERQAADDSLGGAVNLGGIALGCALGYLDFRFPDDKWRDGRPALAAWFEGFAQRPSMRQTEPPAA
jgi:glutathione S-transferase